MSASLQIVRRFTRQGGMESYVWHLSQALAQLGHPVEVLCQTLEDEIPAGVQVHTLGASLQKPRWLSMLRFSKEVSGWVRAHPNSERVIHSHERTAVHQVTTLHGPLIHSRKKRLLDGISPRLRTWEYLERRELTAPQVVTILPNSEQIAAQIRQYYPDAISRIGPLALPGVDPSYQDLTRAITSNTVGFVGKEWERKGLPFLVELLTPLLAEQPTLKLLVAGPEPSDIAHLFKSWPKANYQLLGWYPNAKLLPQVSLIAHPARNEPFGMAIAEANAAGIPVLVSPECGISQLIKPTMGAVIPRHPDAWQTQIRHWLTSTQTPERLTLSWTHLAEQHAALYHQILSTE